jgi:putative DNA primase/helicase
MPSVPGNETGVNRPSALAVRVETIPQPLCQIDHWVVWAYTAETDPDTGQVDYSKPPYDPNTGRRASSTDPRTWTSFVQALAVYRDRQLDGIGFCLRRDGRIVAIDLDKCRDPVTGVIEASALEIVRLLGSYTEISPSGRGLRIFVYGTLPPSGRKRGRFECYEHARYVTVTGHVLEGVPQTIEERQAEIERVHAQVFAERHQNNSSASRGHAAGPVSLDDAEIIRRASQARNGAGDRFNRLWNGDTTGYASASEADLALVNHLCFWCGPDEARIADLFSQSGLHRSKWNREDYRQRTIARALQGRTQYFTGQRPGAGSGNSNSNGVRDAQSQDEPASEAANDPHRLARLFAQDYVRDGVPTLRYWQAEWHVHSGGAFGVLPAHDLKGRLVGRIKAEFDRLARAGHRAWEAAGRVNDKGKPQACPVARRVTTRLLADVVQALAGMVLIPSSVQAPAWLDQAQPAANWKAKDLLVCRNKIVNLPQYVEQGRDYEMEPTPRLLSVNALDYDFASDAPRPVQWENFLHSLWPDDEETIRALQLWFGYCLLPDTSLHKILMMVGPRRSGKGTIARVLRALLGLQNTVAPTLASLTMNFGLWPLVGKTLAIISDARLSGRTDTAVAVERLLSISGEDAQTIDRKNLPPITCSLPVRFMILTNELPRLHDVSGALVGRLVLLRLTESFYGREDTQLTARLLTELPGILGWAIQGYERLGEQGHIHQPASGKKLVAHLEDLTSPITAFLRECCKVACGCEVFCRDLYERWQRWTETKGVRDAGESVFGRDLHAAVPTLDVSQPRGPDGQRARKYIGIRLRRDEDEDEDED